MKIWGQGLISYRLAMMIWNWYERPMARRWRIEYEGALYRVFSRGNNQQDIFVTDDDRYLFLDTIGQMSERFVIDIFVSVLMDNHYHKWLDKDLKRYGNGIWKEARIAQGSVNPTS